MDGERRVEPWPWILVGLLLAMMVGSLGFYAVAARHPDPVLVDDAFAASERYNAVLARQREARALGVELAVAATPSARGVLLRVELAGPGAAGDAGARVGAVSVRRVRPAEGGLDASFSLRARRGGFEAEVPLPRPGRWRLDVRADVGGHLLRRSVVVGRS